MCKTEKSQLADPCSRSRGFIPEGRQNRESRGQGGKRVAPEDQKITKALFNLAWNKLLLLLKAFLSLSKKKYFFNERPQERTQSYDIYTGG